MLNAREICTDATVIRTNGKQSFIRNFSTEKSVVYYSSKKKDLETLEQFWILKEYAGTLTHDHETALYYFGVVKDVETFLQKLFMSATGQEEGILMSHLNGYHPG